MSFGADVDAEAETRTFGVTASEIGEIDRWIEQIGTQWGQSERTVFGARLCIAELAANVLEHGIAKVADDRIAITLRRCSVGIAIEFVDSRKPFDPTHAAAARPAETLDEAEPGGRGLRLLRAYADDLSYRNDGTFNRVTMKVRSAPPKAGRLASDTGA
jgi:serine/threonine-protein kinase RsbW